MNYLEQIIQSFDTEDISQFQSFIQRGRQRKNRKDLNLFNLIAGGEYDKEKLKASLNIENLNAYHTLRKRLYLHISDFILLKSKDQDATASARVNSLLNLSIYLFTKGLNAAAWKLLIRAERLAKENELFDRVNTILLLAIEQCHLQSNIELSWLEVRYRENSILLRETERITLIQAALKSRVIESKREGKEISFQDIFSKTLMDYKMIRLSRQSPKILYWLLKTFRQWVIARKEFNAFEPTIERSFLALKTRDNHYYMSQIILMLAHTKYRNKKFKESFSYLTKLENHISMTPISFQREMSPKVTQLKAANLIFLNNLSTAISLLNQLLQSRLTEIDKSNIIVNLGIYHFYEHNYQECLKLLSKFEHTDSWYKSHMGIEWLLKRDLMAILLYNDSGDKGLAESKIRSVERKFSKLFDQDRYKRVKVYLSLIKQVVFNENSIDLKQLEERVEVSFDWVSFEEKDLQAMMFFAWLRGKIVGCSFYDSIVELVSSNELIKNDRLIRR